MFNGASGFNNPLYWGGQNTHLVTDMSYMFQGATSFNQIISGWDVFNVTNMSHMFDGATNFNNYVSWGTTTQNVTNMSYMFNGATNFNKDVSSWDVSKVTNMSYMFNNASAFNGSVVWGVPNTHLVTDMSHMFFNATAFNQNISGWDVSSVTTMENMLDNCGLSYINYNSLLENWSTQDVKSNVPFGVLGLVATTFNAGSAREKLTKGLSSQPPGHAWVINGDAIYLNPSPSPTINFGYYNNNISPTDSYQLYYQNISVSDYGTYNANPSPLLAFNLNPGVTGLIPIILKDNTSSTNIATFYVNIGAVCFKENTKILTDQGYLPIQSLKIGDIIKTSENGYKRIHLIKHGKIYNPNNKDRVKDRLYKLTKDQYPELTEDLFITGCHAILVDDFANKEQRDKTVEIIGNTFVTGHKFRLPACADEKAVPYEEEGVFNIYHLALENNDNYMNYGIYANGLLAETCSKFYLEKIVNL